jgi:hypothetical protein
MDLVIDKKGIFINLIEKIYFYFKYAEEIQKTTQI